MVGVKARSVIKKFRGEKYTLMSNVKGTKHSEAEKIKKKLKEGKFSVRVDWSGAQPHVYPEGRYFVYARKKKKVPKFPYLSLEQEKVIEASKKKRR